MNLLSIRAFGRMSVMACSALLFSFSPPGGDSYVINLNKKQIVREFVTMKSKLPSIALDAGTPNDQLEIFYSHCGEIGKSRKLSLRDSQDKLLKEFKFPDVIGDEHTPMVLQASDVLPYYSSGATAIKLVYAASQLPEGRILATISLRDVNTAGLRP